MDTIVISVQVPSLGASYDFKIPKKMLIKDALTLIIKIFSAEYGVLDNCQNALLFDLSDLKPLNLDSNFEESGIGDGSRLLLI